MTAHTILSLLAIIGIAACNSKQHDDKQQPIDTVTIKHKVSGDSLPLPYATKSSVNFSKVIGWPKDRTPIAPGGFTVTKFADNLQNPRWIYVTPNGDILVAESNTEA